MKENTKFLWMYVGILFSFALILIIFAGLSQSNDSEQTKGLKSDITELSQKNTQLVAKNKEQSLEIESLNAQIEALTLENETLKADAETKKVTEDALMNAVAAFNSGNRAKSRQIISTIDPQNLTDAQKYIYNRLVS